MKDAEWEAHIRSLGELMQDAYQAGDRSKAVEWQSLMFQAIAGRSDEQKSRMQREIDAAIDADPCFFCAVGEMHRMEMSA